MGPLDALQCDLAAFEGNVKPSAIMLVDRVIKSHMVYERKPGTARCRKTDGLGPGFHIMKGDRNV
jgi:hypothetical protein